MNNKFIICKNTKCKNCIHDSQTSNICDHQNDFIITDDNSTPCPFFKNKIYSFWKLWRWVLFVPAGIIEIIFLFFFFVFWLGINILDIMIYSLPLIEWYKGGKYTHIKKDGMISIMGDGKW